MQSKKSRFSSVGTEDILDCLGDEQVNMNQSNASLKHTNVSRHSYKSKSPKSNSNLNEKLPEEEKHQPECQVITNSPERYE